MKYDLKSMKNDIAAIIPSSHPAGGEATLLITTKGNKLLDRRSFKWIIRRLAFYHNIDLNAARDNYGSLLGCKRYVPIALSSHLVYLPLPLQACTQGQERRLGFISCAEVKTVQKAQDTVELTLHNGIKMNCQESMATVKKRFQQGKVLLQIKSNEAPALPSSFADPLPLVAAEHSATYEELARLTATILYLLKMNTRENTCSCGCHSPPAE